MLCKCGCGEQTNLALRTDAKRGTKKGEPLDYAYGHKRRETQNDFEWRKQSSERKSGKPVTISPYVPETILRWDSYHNRWQTRNPRTGSTAFHAQVVWEYYNGPVPDGYAVHHKNGRADRLDDDNPNNLMLLEQDLNNRLFPTLAKHLGVSEEVITNAYLEADRDFKYFLNVLSGL